MRCRRAQEQMTAAADRALGPRRRAALDRHVARCAACAREVTATRRLLDTVAGLMTEAEVPVALEQATLRRVRLAAAEEDETVRQPRWWSFPVPALAFGSAAALALAIGLVWWSGPEAPAGGARSGLRVATASPSRRGEQRTPGGSREVRLANRAGRSAPPQEPPPELAAAPDLFVDLPLLKNMEKLEHFEAIRTTTVDEVPAVPGGQEPPSNG